MLKRFKLIFIFIPYHPIGGAERVHLNIIKSLHLKPLVFFDNCNYESIGHDFKDSAYCFSITGRRRREFAFKIINILSYLVPITFFGCNSSLFYNFVSRCKGRVKSIDLTHAFSYPDHGMEISSLPYVDLLDKRVVINQKTKDDYKMLYASNKIDIALLNRFVVIPNGIPILNFENLTASRFDNFTIGFVGRNSHEKRPELFLEIFKKSKVKAKLIGDNFEIYKKDFPNVTYFENCNDAEIIRKQCSEISLLIVPSSREGFPLVIMEAMELGIPVIATDVGSISEHVINDKNGYVGPVEATAFLNFSTEWIEKIIDDKELYFELSLNARAYANQNFNIENFKINYRKLFYE